MASHPHHHDWHSYVGRDKIFPLQFLSPPSYDAGSNSDRDSTHLVENRNMPQNGFPSNQQRPGKSEYVRHHQTTLIRIALYLPLLIIPFPLTAVMVYHPLKLPSYIEFRSYYQVEDFDFNDRTQVVIQILNSIRAVATIPLIDSILAQVAAIHTQRRFADSRKLMLSQTLALANRGWTEPWIVWQAFIRGSMILPFGALMVFIFAITQPLEQLLLQTESLNVLLCGHNVDCSLRFSGEMMMSSQGKVPSPHAVAQATLYGVLNDVSQHVMKTRGDKPNIYLWPDLGINYTSAPDSVVDSGEWFSSDDKPFQAQPFYTTSLQNGTTTGVLRQHAMRLNSSIGCEYITAADYPTECPGDRPFTNSWNGSSESMDISLDICVPGNYSQTPWTQSRDRQDLREEMYIKSSINESTPQIFRTDSFTLHCVAMTSRGYFELGNVFNGDVPQPLLDTWPTPEVMEQNFVDYEVNESDNEDRAYLLEAFDNITQPVPFSDLQGFMPNEYQNMLTDYTGLAAPTPGPLTMSAISIFGNQSFIGTISSHPVNIASEIFCSDPHIPFVYFSPTDAMVNFPSCVPAGGSRNGEFLCSSVANWLSNWLYLDDVHKMLSFSMFYANRATMDAATSYTGDTSFYNNTANPDKRPPRTIYTSEGYTIQKPSAKFASLVVLGALYIVQLMILIAFVVYICRNPTWTRNLDAFSLVRVVASMDREILAALASFSESSAERMKTLDQLDGLIGVEEEMTVGAEHGSYNVHTARRLKIGGTGALV